MTIGNRMKKGTPLALVLSLALVLVPVGAQANQAQVVTTGTSVCNTARPNNQDGILVTANYGDPQGPMKHSDELTAMKGGSVNGALHSPALALCGEPMSTGTSIT